MAPDDPRPDDLLPLPTATFHILLAVADDDRHGYGIIQHVASCTGGQVKMSAGTLYRSIQRMIDRICSRRSTNGRRRRKTTSAGGIYRITPFGRAVARAESGRLRDLLRLARASGFAPRGA